MGTVGTNNDRLIPDSFRGDRSQKITYSSQIALVKSAARSKRKEAERMRGPLGLEWAGRRGAVRGGI